MSWYGVKDSGGQTVLGLNTCNALRRWFNLVIHGSPVRRAKRKIHTRRHHVLSPATVRTCGLWATLRRPVAWRMAEPSPLYSRQTQKKRTRKIWVLRTEGDGRPRIWSSIAPRGWRLAGVRRGVSGWFRVSLCRL